VSPDRQAAQRRRTLRRRRRIALLVLTVLVFVVGIALGEALHDNPVPGRTQTFETTVDPGSLTTVTTGTTATATP
jgi:hypothetical protein